MIAVKLEQKMLLLLVPAIVLPVVAIGWLAYTQLRAAVEDNYLREMQTAVREVEEILQTGIAHTAANTALFSTSFLVEKYALTTDEEQRYSLLQRPLLRLFANYQKNFPNYHELRFILPDGYEAARRVSWDMPNVTEDESDWSMLAAMDAKQSGIHTEIAMNPNTGQLALYAGTALRLRDTSVDPLVVPLILRGYFVVTASLDFLREQLQQHRIGIDGRLVLADADGRLHVHHDNIHGRLETGAEPGVLRFSAADLAALRATMYKPGRLTLGARGEEVYAAAAEINPGLYLFAMLPSREVVAATAELRHAVMLIVVSTILAFGLFLYGLLRWLVIGPLQKLNVAAHRIGHGQLDVQVDVDGSDEIGALGRAFSEMARSLSVFHEQTRYLAYHDSLTGLPNRNMFKEYLGKNLAQAKRRKDQLALLFLDMDEFKQVNDTLGHQAGDELLGIFADELTGVLRDGDIIGRGRDQADQLVARLGGDEFIILLPDVSGAEEAATVAQRILDRLARPFHIEDHKFYIGASIGITLYPDDGDSVDALIKHADLAMYEAKRLGKNNFQFFRPDMNELALSRVRLEQQLRAAVRNSDFALHYQPIVELGTGRVRGVEALVRWREAETGALSLPHDFIPVAEETGLIVPIGEWVLWEACRQGAVWHAQGRTDLVMSVNASSLQVVHEDLPALIERVLRETGLPADCLNLEITETSIMSTGDKAMETLKRIKALGVSVSLDDFGSGYSSLSYVRQFAIDSLKIDQSFVRDCADSASQRSIISAIIAMAHALDLQVVGEGVETLQELHVLEELGCDLVQGFLYSRPLPADKLVDLLTGGLPTGSGSQG